jgi:hypothetical protein
VARIHRGGEGLPPAPRRRGDPPFPPPFRPALSPGTGKLETNRREGAGKLKFLNVQYSNMQMD